MPVDDTGERRPRVPGHALPRRVVDAGLAVQRGRAPHCRACHQVHVDAAVAQRDPLQPDAMGPQRTQRTPIARVLGQDEVARVQQPPDRQRGRLLRPARHQDLRGPGRHPIAGEVLGDRLP